jgi:hypothetical protein
MPTLLDAASITLRLAKVYKFGVVDNEVMDAYLRTVGHRSLVDLNKAYDAILREKERRFMPTPGELLAACGPVYSNARHE